MKHKNFKNVAIALPILDDTARTKEIVFKRPNVMFYLTTLPITEVQQVLSAKSIIPEQQVLRETIMQTSILTSCSISLFSWVCFSRRVFAFRTCSSRFWTRVSQPEHLTQVHRYTQTSRLTASWYVGVYLGFLNRDLDCVAWFLSQLATQEHS